MFSTKHNKSRGVSLVEVMVTIVIGAILMGVVSNSFPQLKRAADRFLNQALFEEQYLIFLLRFEDEYQQAASYDPEAVEQIGQMMFKQDENLDGDLNDSGERIGYRWNEKEQRIDRKSGSGNYQALLDGVTGFSWTQIKDTPVCHELQLQTAFTNQTRRARYCMVE
jgi:prepilin-type N-terminal cleavage/methylation domain-containing protein